MLTVNILTILYKSKSYLPFRFLQSQIHIVLETLIDSFYRQHNDIQHILNTLEPRERMHFLSSKQTNDYCSPLPYKKTVNIPPPLSAMTPICRIPPVHNDRKRENPTFANKKQIMNRSRIGRDKLKRLFTSNTDLNCEKSHFKSTAPSNLDSTNESGNSNETPVPSPLPSRYNQEKSSTIPMPSIAIVAHRWNYATSNHVYAVKVVDDIQKISLEGVDWFDSKSNQASRMPHVPRLSLEWPKNWSFSNL